MKLIFVTLALVTATSVLANNPAVFTGRYRTEHGETCMRDGATRAYVTVSTFAPGIRGVNIQYYSSEAVSLDIPAQSGRAPSQGASHLTDAISVSWSNATTMNARIHTTGTSYNQRVDYTSTYTLSKRGNKLTVVEGSRNSTETCVLTRY